MPKFAKLCSAVTAALCVLCLLSISASGQGGALTFTTTTLPGGAVDSVYFASVLTTGGIAPITFTISAGGLPPGLTLASYGAISGTPTTTGTFNFTVRAVDSALATTAQVATQALSITVNQAMVILPNALPYGVVGLPYSQPLSLSGGFPPYSGPYFSSELGSPVPGLDFFVAGVLSGTPTQAGTTTFGVYAYDQYGNNVSRSYTLNIYTQVSITNASLPTGRQGQAYSAQLTASGGVSGYTFAVSTGPLPPGLSMNSAGLISGTPTSTGSFPVTFRVTDSVGQTNTRQYTVSIQPPLVDFTPTTLPDAIVSRPYTAAFTPTGGIGQYVFSVIGGTLPAGLVLSPAGIVSGTPTAAGLSAFTVRLTSAGQEFVEKAVQVTVQLPPVDFSPAILPDATSTVAYSASFTPTGGTGQYVFTLIGGSLPPGLTLSSAGVVSGTPTLAGTSEFIVLLTSGQASLEKSVRITVRVPPLVIQTSSVPDGLAGQSYSQSLSASGGLPPYSWSIAAGSLPSGVALNSGGSLQGIPTRTGTFQFTAQVMDSQQTNTSRSFSLVIGSNLAIITASLPEAVRDVPYQETTLASGGIPPYTFAVLQGTLPPGITIESTGALSGTPTSSGTFQFTASVADTSGFQTSAALSLIVVEPLELAPARLPAGNLTSAYDLQMQPAGGTPPYTLTLSGALPPGVAFQNGTFSGRPTEPGVYPVEITLVDARGRHVVHANQLIVRSNIAIVTTSPLPQGTVGEQYSTTFQATSGVGPYTWESTGALPGGLTLNPSTGVLSGKLTKAGVFSFDISVFDATEASAVRAFSATIVLPPMPPLVFTQIGSTAPPAQQPTFGLRINQPYPIPVDGIVTLTFAPDRFGDDPAVMFSNGGRTMPFTIPAGQQDATFGSATAALQTGTSAGTITLTSKLSVDGTDVTPSPAPQQTVLIAPSVPVITKLELNRVSGGFELVVTGYSTPRQLTQAVVKITPTSGSVLATSEFPIPIESVFTSYYGSSASAPYGSQFRLVIPFYVPQGLAGLASASVTLTNSVGSSSLVSANF